MKKNSRYPKINIRSKNELAKRISSKKFSQQDALNLINDVIANFDQYWRDSKSSQPEKGKYVRSSVGTPLHKLLKLLNNKVLKVHDDLVPDFIFGGISKRSHLGAAYSLLGKEKQRTLLKMDLSKFFEQISRKRVFYFYYKKCGCSVRASNLLATLCCVPLGPKGTTNSEEVLARGFSTSPRLAVWANLDTFLRLNWEAQKKLKGKDPKIAIFVDDIGVSSSRTSVSAMEVLREIFKEILEEFDLNQPLKVNCKKTKIKSFTAGVDHLGLRLGRNKISIGAKTKSKKAKLIGAIRKGSSQEKKQLKNKKVAYYRYEKQIANINRVNN